MSVPKRLLSLAVLSLAFAAPPARALDWSDNSFHLWWGPTFREPGVVKATDPNAGQDIAKTVVAFTHASGDKWGGHFLNVDMLMSDYHDATAGLGAPTQGATEVYAVYRRALALGKISGSKAFTFPGVRDVAVDLGTDLSAKNTTFAPHVMKLFALVGPSFDVPGFLNVQVGLVKEWNNNGLSHGAAGFGHGGSVTFDVAFHAAASWGIHFGSLPIELGGFANLTAPKGKDGFGGATKTEILLHPKLMWDFGSMLGSKGYELGVGYQYWKSKFGNDNSKVPGSDESSVFVEAAVHL
jgi:hypothetical protein